MTRLGLLAAALIAATWMGLDKGHGVEPMKLDPSCGYVAIKCYDLPDGVYYLEKKGGNVTFGKLPLLDVSDPDDPPMPDPSLNQRAKLFQSAALQVTDPTKEQNAVALAAVYSAAAEQVKTFDLRNYSLIAQLVKAGEAQVLGQSAAAWATVTDLSSTELAKVAATSDVSSADYVGCLEDAAEGLDPKLQAIDPAIWKMLIDLFLKLIIEWISNR